MRPYATVSPLFWTGTTGKRLRKNPDAQRVAIYLMTSPHSHQSGLYQLPLMYLCNEVGIGEDSALRALEWLDSEGYSKYDQETEWVWVCEMAAWQIGDDLQPADKRCKGVQQYLKTIPDVPWKGLFLDRYRTDYHLETAPNRAAGAPNRDIDDVGRLRQGVIYTLGKGSQDPFEGASSEQIRTEQIRTEQQHSEDAGAVDDAPVPRRRGTRIKNPFPVTDAMRAWAADQYPNVDVKAATAEFVDYWIGVPGAKGVKLDWDATWRNRIREVAARSRPRANGAVAAVDQPQPFRRFPS